LGLEINAFKSEIADLKEQLEVNEEAVKIVE
jgi:hypothetical protein